MAGPNLIWITLDSLRADHTSMQGYDRETTPSIQSLGKKGESFRQCFAHSRETKPSSAAILSGTPPTHNTVGISGTKLPKDVPTVAERFSNAGYHTGLLSRNGYVSPSTDLDRGFDRFQWVAAAKLYQLHPMTILKFLLQPKKHSGGLTLNKSKHSGAFLVTDTAKRWLADFSDGAEPFFFYLHYNEPHRPFVPPVSYRDQFTHDIEMSATEAVDFALKVHANHHDLMAEGCELTEPEWEALHAMYDAEIAYTDAMVGDLLEHVRSLNLEETVVVVTADHGEHFGERGLLGHGYVLDSELTHVPLVVEGLDGLVAGPNDLVQHVDVMRTVLSLAGANTEGMAGVDLRDERREFAVSQTGPNNFDHLIDRNPDFDASRFHQSTQTALRTEKFRYQRSDDRSELFERPEETTDISDDYPDVAAELDEKLSRWYEMYGQPVGEGKQGKFSAVKKRQLRDLGYLE